MADLSGMIGSIDDALAQGAPPPGGMPSSAPRGTSDGVRSFVGSIDATLRQGVPGAPGGGRSAYQGTLDALNAALAPDPGSSPNGDGGPSTVTVQQGPTYNHTLSALDAALNSPPGTRIIMGAASPVPAGLTPRGAAQPDLDSVPPSARPGTQGAPDAFDPQPADAAATGGTRPLTIRAGQPDAPNPDGPLANSPDDGWLSGAAKGAATGLIKGAGQAAGFYNGMGDLVDTLMAGAEAKIRGVPLAQAQADRQARKAFTESELNKDPLYRNTGWMDPANVMPTAEGVTAPVLAKTGSYEPTSEVGRLAQAGVEAVPAMIGPGGGMVSPGTAGRAVLGTLARQAPAMAVGGAASQGAVDATGNPIAGLAAGVLAPALAEGGMAAARGGAGLAGRLLAPVAGGSDRLNNTPVIGPALQAGREAAVANKIVGQSSDPAALKAWAAGQPDAPEVPNSPRTLAGAVGDDAGLYQAEKDARNVNNARPTASVTVDGRIYGGQSFNGVDRAQSDAQLSAMQSGQQGADVFRPGAMIRDRMDAIEAAAQQAEDRLNAAHADAVQSTTQAGQAFASDQQSGLAQRAADRAQAGLDFAAGQRGDLAEREAARGQAAADDKLQAQGDRDDAHAQLVQTFKDAQAQQTEAVQRAAGGLGAPIDDDSLGGALRGAVEQVRAGARDMNRQLYKAVDPDGTLAMVASPIGDAAQRIAGQIRQNGADLSAAEAPLFRRAAALPDVATYGTVHQLDTDLSAAMSAERRSAGETPAWGRLQQLKGAVKGAMTNAADNQAQHEARLVDAGVMDPADTIRARLRADFDAATPGSRIGTEAEAGRATGTNDGGAPTARAPADSRALGAEVSRGRDAGSPAGGQSLQADAGRGPVPQGLSPADFEARVFRQSVPAEPGHRVVPVDADKVDVLTGWQPDYRIAPGAGGPGGKLARASDFISNLGEGQDFRPPVLGVHDQGMGFDDGRHRFSAMRDLGFKTVPVSMDAASEAAARRLGLVNETPAREVGTGPRPDAPGFDPDGGPGRAPTRPDVPRPQDLRAFVRSRGGMRDTGGDLAAMGMPELIGRGARALDPDKMREAAAEAGYLGADTARAMRETHPNDLLDALSGDRPVHSVRDEDAAAAWATHDEARERYDAARGEFGTRSRFGVVPERAPLDSYGRDDIEGPSGPQMREPAPSGLRPSFGAEAAGRLKAANAAYADYARTYKNPIVGPGLRTTGFSGDYQRGDAAFIRGAVKPGPLGYENARAHLLAARNDSEAVEAMHDAVLNPLRRAALGPGFLPPSALANWRDSYGPALRALDEVTPGFSRRFDDAGRATQALLDTGAEHKATIEAARKEGARQALLDDADRRTRLGQANAADRDAVSNLLAERRANDRADAGADKAATSAAISDRAASDRAALAQSKAETADGIGRARDIRREARATPAAQFAAGGGTGVASTEVENAVGSYLKTGTAGPTRMRGLVQSVGGDPEALDGLRKAGTDWLVRNHTNTDGSLSGSKLIGFLKQNADTLRELYPHEQVSMMGAVARDAEAGARWRTTTAVKGGSDSVKNLLAAAAEGHRGLHATLGMVAVEAVAQGFEHGGLTGAAYGGAGAAALYMMNSMRQAGIRRTSDLYMAALADPELARALISKMPKSATGGPVTLFARSLHRAAILGSMATGEARERARQAAPAHRAAAR